MSTYCNQTLCLPALAIFTKQVEFAFFYLSHHIKTDMYFVPLLGRFSIGSVSTPWTNFFLSIFPLKN